MKPLTMTVFLTALLSIFASDVQAQPLRTTSAWSSESGDIDLADGVPDIGVTFSWVGGDNTVLEDANGDGIDEYPFRVQWFLDRDGWKSEYVTHSEVDGFWLLCGDEYSDRDCGGWADVGSLTVKATLIFGEDSVMSKMGEASITFDIIDSDAPEPEPTVSNKKPDAQRARNPYCYGNEGQCVWAVKYAWGALTSWCYTDRPGRMNSHGGAFAIGKGAYIQCP